MKRTGMEKIIAVFTILVALTVPAHADDWRAKDKKLWLDAQVTAVGHVDANGRALPSVTVEVDDPENVDPAARRVTLVITADEVFRLVLDSAGVLKKSHIDGGLVVGMMLKVNRWHEADYRNGQVIHDHMDIQYQDKKGNWKTEDHDILQALRNQ